MRTRSLIAILSTAAFCSACDFGGDRVAWPPVDAPTIRASHRTDQTFLRKDWRDAIHFEASDKPRSFSLGPLGDADALRMGIMREGYSPEPMNVEVHVGRTLVERAQVPYRRGWSEYLVDLSSFNAREDCSVTFNISDVFYVAPLELVPSSSPKPNVLIVVLDTLRADRCSTFGYHRATTPNLDEFAKEGVVFEKMLSASSWTRPAIASLLTGTFPSRHGARTYTDIVRAEVPRVAKLLMDTGYATYGFARNANVHPYWGIGNEFFHFSYFGVNSSDDQLVHQLRRTLPKIKGKPWFAYIHLLNPHGPYLPDTVQYGPYKGMKRSEYSNAFLSRMISDDPGYAHFAKEGFYVQPDEYADLVRAQGDDASAPTPLGNIVRESADLYDSEIREADARFGEIIRVLKKTEQFDNTIIILLSDHGEEFFEHENWTHGKTVYEEVVHVPFVMRLPSAKHGGRRVNSIVETVDIAPTILDYLVIDTPQSMQGRTLLPLISGDEQPDHIGFASVFRDRDWILDLSAVRWRNWKLIVDHQTDTNTWYDLDKDPLELSPVQSPPVNSAAMLERVESLRPQLTYGLHLVLTCPIDIERAVFTGRLTLPNMAELKVNHPKALTTIERSGNTIDFRIELSAGETEYRAHRPTHAEIIIRARPDDNVSVDLRKDGQQVQSILVPASNGPRQFRLLNESTPLMEFLAPAELASVSVTPADGSVYAWYIPETESISEDRMDEGMRESLEAMGYL